MTIKRLSKVEWEPFGQVQSSPNPPGAVNSVLSTGCHVLLSRPHSDQHAVGDYDTSTSGRLADARAELWNGPQWTVQTHSQRS